MSTTVQIESANDDTKLTITGIKRAKNGSLHDYEVQISKTEIECAIKVGGYLSDGFGDYFKGLNDEMQNNGGWEGTKSWASLEGELHLDADSDSLGHTTLIVTLKSGHYDLDWDLKIGLLLDASQLQNTTRAALVALQFPPND